MTGAGGAGDQQAGGIDQKVLRRVRALLAKAESTSFDPEAEALTAKAQELMARHAIDSALVAAANGGAGGSAPISRRLRVEDPYAAGKSWLLDRIAAANRCRVVQLSDRRTSEVFGHPADLDAVELLFTSLLVQGAVAVQRAGSQRSVDGRSRTRSFRSSFWLAYAERIGDRLAEAQRSVVDEAVDVHGAALVPVLAARAADVDAAIAAAYPRLRMRTMRASNGSGWAAGTAAADRAQLGGAEALRGGR